MSLPTSGAAWVSGQLAAQTTPNLSDQNDPDNTVSGQGAVYARPAMPAGAPKSSLPP
jgi:hypothetical protein